MHRLLRWTVAGVVLSGLACSNRGPNSGSVVYQFQTNDYQFEHDGEQKRVTIGPGLMRMVRHPEDIEVSAGTLRVGDRDYGAVAKNDRISVVGGKVAVNGRERQALGP